MDQKEIDLLLAKYKSGSCTEPERQQLYAWLNTYARESANPLNDPEELYVVERRILKNLEKEIQRPAVNLWRYKIVAAAAVLLVGIAAIYLLMHQPGGNTYSATYRELHDVAPGGNKAVLILADGRKVELDSAGAHQVVQGNSKITITNGEAVYSPEHNSYDNQNVVNTIVTPKGGQFQLTLSDGTKVWLNAASSLSFAPTFAGQQKRVVRLSGEAYFDVAHDARHPFIVETPKQQIKVLGTRFNVHSYPDENAVTTSLLEGKVEISTSLVTSKILYPGQAATTEGKSTRLTAMNEYAAAWISGQIRFEEMDLHTILLTVSRWYDLTIIYEGTPLREHFTGGILRKSSLSAFLKVLDSWNVKHELREGPNGKELIIKK